MCCGNIDPGDLIQAKILKRIPESVSHLHADLFVNQIVWMTAEQANSYGDSVEALV